MKVLEAMRVHVNVISPAATLAEALDRMDLYQMTLLPVVGEEGRLEGVISEKDLEIALLVPYVTPYVKPHLNEAHGASSSDSREALSHIAATNVLTPLERAQSCTVSEYMTSPAVAVDEQADIADALDLMLSHRLKRIPVTANGRLVGLIGRVDIAQALVTSC